MEVGIRTLRNETTKVIAAVEGGERVTLTVRGRPVADIVPHGYRSPWLSGDGLARELNAGAADAGLTSELEALVGQTLDDV